MSFSEQQKSSFYPLEGVVLMIEFDEVWGMNLIGVFPSVIAFGVSFPFNEILEHPRPSMTLVAPYQLHFVFRFSINQFRRWSGKVGAM